MNEQYQSFRLREPHLADKLLYQKIMSQANWEYPIGDLIAHGGMSSVYALKTPKEVPRQVVKVIDTRMIRPELRQIVRDHGLDECSVMAQLTKSSDFIMPLYGSVWSEVPDPFWRRTSGSEPERIYLLHMPRMRNLTTLSPADLPEREIIQLGMDISSALQVCYSINRIHRDVKPGNIFIRKRRERLCYILGDFGIARVVDDRTLTGVGTEQYLAPELCSGWLTRSSDIYSLGATMFELAGGTFGPGDTSGELAWGNRLEWQAFKRSTRISAGLQNILRKSLQNHHDRYRQPSEMYEELWWLQQHTT